MIKKCQLLLFLVAVSSLTAQSEIHGKIVSSITGEAPAFLSMCVEIRSEGESFGNIKRMFLADSLGDFLIKKLEPNKKYQLKISVAGYDTHFFDLVTNNRVLDSTFFVNAECENNIDKADKDWKEGDAKLFIIGSIAPKASTKRDCRFEKKYNIEYYDFGCLLPNLDCIITYNRRVFELLDKKYGSKWRKKVRKDVEGYN